jgi:hypothetical protein
LLAAAGILSQNVFQLAIVIFTDCFYGHKMMPANNLKPFSLKFFAAYTSGLSNCFQNSFGYFISLLLADILVDHCYITSTVITGPLVKRNRIRFISPHASEHWEAY